MTEKLPKKLPPVINKFLSADDHLSTDQLVVDALWAEVERLEAERDNWAKEANNRSAKDIAEINRLEAKLIITMQERDELELNLADSRTELAREIRRLENLK